MLALQQRRNALKTHAGINGRARKCYALILGDLLKLHEDQVPDFDEPIAVLICRTRRTTPDVVAMVVKDFRARTARTGITHGPEIVGGRDANDAIV